MIILDNKRNIERKVIRLKGDPVPMYKDNDEEEVNTPVEIAEVIRVLNSDKRDKETRMSEVDFKAVLDLTVFGAYLAYDSLSVFRFIPVGASFLTQQGKRLSVSVNGQGRKDSVAVANGIQERRDSKSFGERLGNMFRKKENGQI